MGTTGSGSAADRRLADKSYVIVALPKTDDPVNSLSTEKKPHLTLLYLGEQLDNPRGVEKFIRHAATNSLSNFFLTVKNRGLLGKDKADVLFFDKYRLAQIEDFRAQLRSNPDIEKAYLSTPQYPEWIPHLTLGYPEKPHVSSSDEIYQPVIFDRLALWSGDSEGPEFPLRPDPEGMAMSVDLGREYLAHYGVKGMRWGVRNSESSAGGTRNVSADASRARKTQQKVNRHGGTHVVSNKELQDLVTRLNLEQQYNRLNPLPPTTAQKVSDIVAKAGAAGRSMNTVIAFVNSPAGKLIRKTVIGV